MICRGQVSKSCGLRFFSYLLQSADHTIGEWPRILFDKCFLKIVLYILTHSDLHTPL